MDSGDTGQPGQQPPPGGASWANAPMNLPDASSGVSGQSWPSQGPAYPPPNQPNQPWYPTPDQAPYASPGQSLHAPPGQPPYGPPLNAYLGVPPYGNTAPPATPYGGYPYANPPTAPFPGAAYPSPVGPIPPVPPKKGSNLAWWQWILMSIGGLVVLLCLCGAITGGLSVLLSGVSAQLSSLNNPQPAPTPTPGPGQSSHMILGANYTQGASGFEIVQPKDSFRANDSLAFVVSLDQSFGTTQVMVILAREGAGGAEFTVNSSPMTIANPDFTQLAGRLPTKALMGVSPAGTYKLEISDGSSILAEATFHYLG